MDLDSTIETVASHIPNTATLSGMLDDASAYIPMDLNFGDVAKFLLFFTAGALILSFLGRLILGKRSSLNHSVSTVMAVLFIYAVTIVIYIFKPLNLYSLLSPLPFVTFFNEYLVILPVVGIRPTVLCQELLSLLILVFLVNLIDILLPQGKSVLSWFLLRLSMAAIAITLHIIIHWAVNTYLPALLVSYAPGFLLSILFLLLTLGFLNAILSLVLTIANPIIAAIYTFFFTNIVGKQVTKAVFSTGILGVILYMIEKYGYSFINISTGSLISCLPVVLVSLLLWYLTGRLL